MDENNSGSLSSQILTLQTKHRQLDDEIIRLQGFPYIDQLKLRRLKKQKLRLKELIDHLKDDLIPDLNA